MSLQDNILDTSRLCLHGQFDEQVTELLQQIRLTRCEVEGLTALFYDLQNCLKKEWPGCQVFPFGSIVTGLGIRTSDVDCYVSLPDWAKRKPAGKLVLIAKRILSVNCYVFSELFAIPGAKVPIVKFYHIPNRRHCDVNFKSPSGVQNSKLLAYLLHLDSRALPLAIIIKYWSKIHKFTGTNLMPNYALIILVVFYLQQENILPSVYALQKSVPEHVVDNWNTAFEEANYVPNNDDPLYELMGGFFQFYGHKFDYDNFVISPFLGYAVHKSSFQKLQTTPEEFVHYKQNVRSQRCQIIKLDSKMCVQDPFEHARNCTIAVYPKLAQKIITYFQSAFKVFVEVQSEDFLKTILTKLPCETELNTKNNYITNKVNTDNKVTKRKDRPNFKKLKRTMQNSFHTWFSQYKRQKRPS